MGVADVDCITNVSEAWRKHERHDRVPAHSKVPVDDTEHREEEHGGSIIQLGANAAVRVSQCRQREHGQEVVVGEV